MEAIRFIINNILTQSAITLALIAMFGLMLQKKSTGQILSGTFKTLLGFLVLSAGSSIIVTTLTYFGKIFTPAFGLRGIIPSIEAINGQAMNELGLGNQIAFTLLAIFIVNILLARFTKWKYIFLTGQALLWMATMCTAFGYFAGFRGATLVVVGGIVGGIFAVAMPALAQPYVRKITGSDDIALGHFCTFGYLFEAYIAKWVGDPSTSVEDIKLPKQFEFLQDTYLSVMVIMVPFFLITAGFAGSAVCQPLSGTAHYMVFAFLQAIQFVVGLYVLMSGVRLILAEIVPAFKGIAMKLVPDAKPALDCPVLFAYSSQAVIVGFVTTTIGTIIGMLVLPMFGLAMILPMILTNFFAGGTAGIFGNVAGGRRGAVIGGIAHGLFITLLPALLVGIFDQLGFVNATATDVDTIAAAMFYAYIIMPVMSLF